MTKENLLYGQSGGPTAVINASMYGVLMQAFQSSKINKVYGAINGVDGILNENLMEFTLDEELNKLLYTPGCALGSVRHKLLDNELPRLYEIFQKYHIRYFLYNGGNDSMDACQKITDYFKEVNYKCQVIGIPKTIDNDLPLTDHAPGYGSAAKYIACSLMELAKDVEVYERGRVTIVEVMGRDTGWLAAASCLAKVKTGKPDLVFIPEIPFDVDRFLNLVSSIYKEQQKVLVVVSEGIKDENGNFIGANEDIDPFGHRQMGGVSFHLSKLVNKKLQVKTRHVEINILQRCAAHIASKTDVEEAIMVGKKAVTMALLGMNGVMVSIKRERDLPYAVTYEAVPIWRVANYVKHLDAAYYDRQSCQIEPRFLTYLLPLVQGENEVKFRDGVMDFYERKEK